MSRLKLCGAIAVLVISATACHATPNFEGAIYDPTAYAFDVTETSNYNLAASRWEYTYTYDLTFYGGAVPGPGATFVRMSAFAIYEPDTSVVVLSAASSGGAANWTPTPNGASVLWKWKTSGNPNGHVMWPAPHSTSTATFQIVTSAPFTSNPPTVIHLLWRDSEGRDQSAWVTNTPELPPSVLSVLGLGGLAFWWPRRRCR